MLTINNHNHTHRIENFNNGAAGREEATGRGVAQIAAATLKENEKKIKGATVAIQGFGNVGRYTALVCQELGMDVIAISDVTGGIFDKKGIDIKSIFNVKNLSEVNSDNRIGASDVLEVECDLLIPAALGGVINDSNAAKVKAEFVIEGANQPITSAGDQKLNSMSVS